MDELKEDDAQHEVELEEEKEKVEESGSKSPAESQHKTDNKDSEDFSFDVSGVFKKKPFGKESKEKGEEKTETRREIKKVEKDKKEKEREKEKKHFSEEESASKKAEEEFYFDWKKIGHFLKNDKIALLLVLIPIILTIMIRIEPNQLAITNDWATNSVYSYYKNSITNQISAMYPNLPDANKQTLVDNEFNKMLKEQGNTINSQIEQTAAFFKSKLQYESDGKSYTYLGDLDSYFFLRYAENLLKYGRQGDIIINKTIQWDNHMTAPLGAPVYPSLHPYSIVVLYKILSIFNKNITLMQSSFYVPLVFAIIATIAAFLIGKRLAGNIAGVVTSVLVAVNPMFLTRTMGSDTDVYNVAFPLLIMWTLIEGFEAKNNKQRILFMGLTGVFMGIFSFAWSGWWYIFDFVIGAIAAYLSYLIFSALKKEKRKKANNIIKVLKESEPIKNTVLLTIIMLISSAVFVTIFSGFTAFIRAPMEPLNFMSIKEVVHGSLWPNVYLTVAEMNPGSFSTIISVVGGSAFLILAIAGIFLIFLKKDVHEHYDVKMGVLLTIWFIGTYFATLKGSRFSLLLVPAFAVGAGATIGTIYNWINNFALKELKIEKYIVSSVLILLVIALMINPVKAGYNAGRGYIPTMNDAWYDTLTKIKNDSSQNAIINSWWDFGHWFKYVADRAVTADGATQNRPQAFWLGRILTTSDEHEAIAVLRMLDCGSNTAFDVVDGVMNDTEESVSIVRQAIMLNKNEARNFLSKYLNKSEIELVLNATDCESPEDHFITSEDMVGKSGVWAHFGMWNFTKAKILVYVKNGELEEARKFMKEELNYGDDQIQKMFYEVQALSTSRDEENWVSPWPAYISVGGSCQSDNKSIDCINNLQGQLINIQINLTTNDAEIVVTQGSLKPYSFVYPTDNGIYEKKYENPDFPFSIILSADGNYQTTIASPELAMSMFTRLFFLGGKGLNHFELFDHETELTGGDIYTWQVSWEGKDIKQSSKG